MKWNIDKESDIPGRGSEVGLRQQGALVGVERLVRELELGERCRWQRVRQVRQAQLEVPRHLGQLPRDAQEYPNSRT